MARSPWAQIAAAYLGLVLVMAAIGAIAGGGDGDDAIDALRPPEPRAAFPLETRSPQIRAGSNLRVLVALRRPALGDLSAGGRRDFAVQRAYVRSLTREIRALQSALRARGVTFGDPVSYARVWAGFAATLSTRDLTAVQAAGLRAEPVRRFYPAQAPGDDAPDDGAPSATAAPPAARGLRLREVPRVAVLDSAVDGRHPSLRGRVTQVADVVGRTRVPPGRRDEHGTQVAGLVAEELPPRARLLAIRVAALQPRAEGGGFEESATTDELLAGMERAVDPDGDGDVEDAVPVALVGVSSPYAGFERAPEGRAAASAAALGTLTVAPAGNQGPGSGPYGSIGSPAAAAATLAVGALAGIQAVSAATVTLATKAGSAAVAGELIGGDARRVRAGVTTAPGRARRKVLVTGRDPGTAVAAAVAAGASALVVCRPAGRLPALPRAAAGGMPVVGLTGDAARRALTLARAADGLARISPGKGGHLPRGNLAPESSAGPTYSLAPKPDLAAAGSALAPVAGGGFAYAAGTSIAAARVAAAAGLLRAARPSLDAHAVGALLVETATPRRGRAARPDLPRAAAAGVVALPHAVRLRPGAHAVLTLRNLGRRPIDARLRAAGVRVPAVVRIPAGADRRIRVSAARGARPGARTISLRAGRTALEVTAFVPGRPPPPHMGLLDLVRKRGRVEGVRFVAGRVRRRHGRLAVEPVGALVLRLAGPERRDLTPPGGARDLLPGEYAYTLTEGLLDGLPRGRYRFLVRARGPAGGRVLTRRSASFRLR